jgi:hypothetical protein
VFPCTNTASDKVLRKFHSLYPKHSFGHAHSERKMSSQPDLHQNWLTSSSKVPRSLDEVTTHSRTGVTLSVVPFVCFVLAVSGLTAWGIMYALNRQSLTSASLAIQQQTVQNIIGVVRDYNTPFIYGVQAIEELLRASERQNPGFVNNTANWLGSAFVIAKQFGGGCYCGYPSGQLFGYRSNDNQTVMRIDTTSDGVLVTSHADQFGEAKNAVSRESGFDVTRRNWYTGAQNRGGFSQTDLYSYAGTEGGCFVVLLFGCLFNHQMWASRIPFLCQQICLLPPLLRVALLSLCARVLKQRPFGLFVVLTAK